MTLRSGVALVFCSLLRWLLVEAAFQKGDAVLDMVSPARVTLLMGDALIAVYKGPDIHGQRQWMEGITSIEVRRGARRGYTPTWRIWFMLACGVRTLRRVAQCLCWPVIPVARAC